MITSNIVPSQRLLAQLCFVAVLGVVVLGGVEAANNSNDEDNNLGLMAKACASYCHSGVNGLDLWVSLEEVSETHKGWTIDLSRKKKSEALPYVQHIIARWWFRPKYSAAHSKVCVLRFSYPHPSAPQSFRYSSNYCVIQVTLGRGCDML